MTTTLHRSAITPISPPPPTTHPLSNRRTNCGKPIYRFSYGRDTIALATPCFEPHCNICTLRQPAVGIYDDNNSAAPTSAARLSEDELRHRKTACYRSVKEQLRRISQLHVSNAMPVKTRKRTGGAVQSGRVEKKKWNKMTEVKRESPSPQQRETNSRTLLESSEKQSPKQKQLLVLKFENHVERFARLAKELERKAAVPKEGQKLFLIIGKGDTLRCLWK
ncbi:hypothetical protein UCDDS831_g04762 [Diplodia seriata]|uniref:Uncharacterized protein n=1 Tax=Diplodia seriata TaxID=420778 RepID=A0A0G2GUJ1_9PEZI|nr:hypothetical protein UCDDS831_g04762 [Diplodia seriata]